MTADTQPVLVAVVAPRAPVQLVLALRELDCAARLIETGTEALDKLGAQPVDLVLIEDDRAAVDGFGLADGLRRLPRYTRVPILLIASGDPVGTRRAGLDAGATDVMLKPLDTLDLTTRLRVLLDLAALRRDRDDGLDAMNGRLARAVALASARERACVRRLMRAAEHRDDEAADHLRCVAGCVIAIAEGLGFAAHEAQTLALASTLHDIGKIALPDSILRDTGPLSEADRETMKLHTLRGHEILSDSSSPLLSLAAEIALAHHERWDGSGYPRGLKAAAIPLSARIVAVADVFEALVSARRYKPAWPLDQARRHIVEQSGIGFDPDCVTAFLSRWRDIAALIEESRAAA